MGGEGGYSARWVALVLLWLGTGLLLIGAFAGWVLPHVSTTGWLALFRRPLTTTHVDVTGYLSADITAMAVIIAVVIGFNAASLQIAGLTHSLALVRVLLRSLWPFLACWMLSTTVALSYFLLPPVYQGQLWQTLLWFLSVILLMLAYLWELPWRLSGQHAGRWSIRVLRRHPLAGWENLDAYSALQSAISGATARGDLGTVRDLCLELGQFLTATPMPEPGGDPMSDRHQYRALKNLLSGCAQHAGDAPNAVAYYLGYVEAGVILKAVESHHDFTDTEHTLVSGLLRSIHGKPEKINSLWTGTRHALCLADRGSYPLLLQFWRMHDSWQPDDTRLVADVAQALISLHSGYWRELLTEESAGEADAESVQMLLDLYRYVAIHLGRQVAASQPAKSAVRYLESTVSLLDKCHTLAMRAWPDRDIETLRSSVVRAYETYRQQLTVLNRTWT